MHRKSLLDIPKQKLVYNLKLINNLIKSSRSDMLNFNKDTYESQDLVAYYGSQSHLQKPEETVLSDFRSKLKHMKMLDIGVGAGRTTYNFANLTKEYIGIDYSVNMINKCKETYKDSSLISFKVCDATSMKNFKDNSFDFILFSFNGIDYINHKDRLKALHEIKRVCKNGGFFFFSTHNLQSIDKLFTVGFSANPVEMLRMIKRYLFLRIANKNPKQLKKEKDAVINDGAYGFSFKTYYIGPKEQIEQLNAIGFKNIRIYSLTDGKEIKDKSNLYSITDDWLYYLCNV